MGRFGLPYLMDCCNPILHATEIIKTDTLEIDTQNNLMGMRIQHYINQ